MLAGKPIVQTQLQALQIDTSIALLQRERSWLQDLKLRLLALLSDQARRVELERLRQIHAGFYVQWRRVGQERDELQQKYPIGTLIPVTAEYRRLEALNERRAQLLADNQRADAAYRRVLVLVNETRVPPPPAPLVLRPAAVNEALAPLHARMFGQKELLNDIFGSALDAGGSQACEVGSFVYSEIPNAERKAGITGRGLEGLTDSVLKVLGV